MSYSQKEVFEKECLKKRARDMTKALLVMLLGFLVLNTVGCSTETMDSAQVSQDAIYQDYDVSYYAESDTTAINAQFRAGGWSGTTLALNTPSYVKANTSILPIDVSWLGTSYDRGASGFIRTVSFEFMDTDQKIYKNTIEGRSVSIQTANVRAPKNSSYKVVLNIEPIRSGESIYVTITQSGTKAHSRTVSGATGVATFTPSDFSEFEGGGAILKVERTYTKTLAEGTSEGGTLSYRYVATPVSIVLE